MAEGLNSQPNPDDLKMKGDFSADVYTPEFYEELQEAGQKTEEEVKKERVNRTINDPQWVVFGPDWKNFDLRKERLPLETPVEQMIRLRGPLSEEKQQSEKELHNSEEYLKTSFDYLTKNEAARKNIADRLKGQVIIDLGAGKSDAGYRLAVILEAKGYVAIEPDVDSCEELRTGNISGFLADSEDRERLIPWAVLNTDMLSFLQSVDDGQISILLCGIDDYIIHDHHYEDSVNSEIDRTLSPNGGVLSVSSEIYVGEDRDISVIKLNDNIDLFVKLERGK